MSSTDRGLTPVPSRIRNDGLNNSPSGESAGEERDPKGTTFAIERSLLMGLRRNQLELQTSVFAYAYFADLLSQWHEIRNKIDDAIWHAQDGNPDYWIDYWPELDVLLEAVETTFGELSQSCPMYTPTVAQLRKLLDGAKQLLPERETNAPQDADSLDLFCGGVDGLGTQIRALYFESSRSAKSHVQKLNKLLSNIFVRIHLVEAVGRFDVQPTVAHPDLAANSPEGFMTGEAESEETVPNGVTTVERKSEPVEEVRNQNRALADNIFGKVKRRA